MTELRDAPAGIVRVAAGKHAAITVLWPALVCLGRTHPDIQVEVRVTSSYLDIVAEGFDAGIRLGEKVENDMVSRVVGPRLKTAVLASPDYLSHYGRPCEPRDLTNHRCICFRQPTGGTYAWEFDHDGKELTVKVGDGPIVNDGDLMVAATVEGFGLAHVTEDMVADQIADGSLVRVLAKWCAPFAGYHLYYPRRRIET